MKLTKVLAIALAGTGILALAAAPALCADEEFCPMGGTLIKVEVDKDKALDWGRDRRDVQITGEDGDEWQVLTKATTARDIAIRVDAGGVFFGVAGRGGEVRDRDVEKAFGKDFKELKEAVKKEMQGLWKADVVDIDGKDVQALSDAAALGTLEKDRDWELATEDCDGVELDASGL